MAANHMLTLAPLSDRAQVDAVVRAVASFDLPSSDAWSDLDELSAKTSFDDLEANVDGIFLRSDGKIEVVGTAYVTLSYGPKKDIVKITESYPAKIIGSFDQNNRFVVESASVDTSSFFG